MFAVHTLIIAGLLSHKRGYSDKLVSSLSRKSFFPSFFLCDNISQGFVWIRILDCLEGKAEGSQEGGHHNEGQCVTDPTEPTEVYFQLCVLSL
jgi:hypothetical protein